MSFFKNLFAKFKKKKDQLATQIREQNEANRVFVADQERYDAGLKRSASAFATAIGELSAKYAAHLDANFENKLTEMLVGLDIGYASSTKVAKAVVAEITYQNVNDPQLITQIIIDKLFVYYIQDSVLDTNLNVQSGRTNVLLMVGVNGVGKTTTIAKIAYRYIQSGMRVLLVAADTFRAGAVEQLKVWAQRTGAEIVTPDGSTDAAAVIYRGIKRGIDEQFDLVICDTSGRLQNKTNLMNELKKMRSVIAKFIPDAPHETLLTLDATTGQSGLVQAKAFHELTPVSGIVLTKLDSSSAGGVILAIKDQFNIPVKLLGVGEGLNDLANFDLEKYVLALTNNMVFDATP